MITTSRSFPGFLFQSAKAVLAPFPLTCGILLAGSMAGHGAVKLITGDSNNNVHQRDATILDLSADGDLVLFASGPPVTGSTPGITQGGFHVRKISTNSLTFVGDSGVTMGPEASFSDNGRYLTWRGTNDNDIYWRDSVSNITRLITTGADGASRRPVMSADGRYVAYASVARNLVSNSSKLQASGRPGIYLYDSTTQTTKVVSLAKSGTALSSGIGSASAVAAAGNEFDFSSDGKYIVFSSDATNDRPSGFPTGFLCVYRRNLTTGAVDILNKTSDGAVSDGNFYTPRISANGTRITFFGGFVGTFGNTRLIDSVNNSFGTDMYVKDANTGEVWWATKTTDKSNSDGAYGSFNAISGDGQTVAFGSTSAKFVTANTDPAVGNSGTFDLFRVDLLSGGSIKTTLVTNSPNGSGNVDYRVGPLLPGNGEYTAFCTSQVEAMLGNGSQDTINFQGFSVSAPALPSLPEITVLAGTSRLADNSGKVSLGTVKVGKSGIAKIFTIKNDGTATLDKLAVKKTGAQAKDFVVTPLTKTSLSDKATTSFKVTFKPTVKGTRSAFLKISSNDVDEDPFEIKLQGSATK